jgi:hypothetical protein
MRDARETYRCFPSPAAEPRPLPETGRGVVGLSLLLADLLRFEQRQPNLAPFRGEVAALPRVRGKVQRFQSLLSKKSLTALPFGVLRSKSDLRCVKLGWEQVAKTNEYPEALYSTRIILT